MSDYLQPRDLGDGLVLRWSTGNDVERIAELYLLTSLLRRSE